MAGWKAWEVWGGGSWQFSQGWEFLPPCALL